MNTKLCFWPHFSSVAKALSHENASFILDHESFVAKFAGKTSFAKVYAPNLAIICSRETLCPQKFLPLKYSFSLAVPWICYSPSRYEGGP